MAPLRSNKAPTRCGWLTGRFDTQALSQQVGRQAAKLIIFAIKVCFIYREGIDEMLDLTVEIAAQPGEIIGKGRRSRGGHTIATGE